MKTIDKKVCIFACGGHGSRMGEPIPKQFLRIDGKTILQLSIEKILDAVPDVSVILSLPAEWIDYWKRECAESGFLIRHSIVKGGITRFHSVKAALDKVNGDGNTIVAVHDGVRPLVSAALVKKLFSLAQAYPAVVPAIAMVDTIKVLGPLEENGLRTENPLEKADRSVLFGAQTPQVFKYDTLKTAYERPYDTSYTDDASVVAATGTTVRYVEGERHNIKITTQEDLLFVRRFLL